MNGYLLMRFEGWSVEALKGILEVAETTLLFFVTLSSGSICAGIVEGGGDPRPCLLCILCFTRRTRHVQTGVDSRD